jgi:hypothetical protein
MNITMTEWDEMEQRIAGEVARRWPWLVRLSPHGTRLRVETPVLTAGAELQWVRHEADKVPSGVRRDADPSRTVASRKATVRTTTHSSACITGSVIDIAEAARQIAEVRDALLFIHGATAGLIVWQDGECPCGHCGGKGLSCGSPCERCGGKGKR